MAALAADTARVFTAEQTHANASYPVKTGVKIYEGAAVAIEVATGYAYIPVGVTAQEVFVGFAVRQADNTSGASGDIEVDVRINGEVKLTAIAGTPALTKIGDVVYTINDNDFSMTDTTNDMPVGRLSKFTSATDCLVRFHAATFGVV